MTAPGTHPEARYDAIVIGGGPAGLSGGLILGRSRRKTLILDAGKPRNAASPAAHGFITHEGIPPGEILKQARAELAEYPQVELRQGEAVSAERTSDGFEVRLEDGTTERARRLLLAVGVRDELPGIPGMSRLWGRGVLHCSYCHGYEVRDKPLAVMQNGAEAMSSVVSVLGLSRDVVLLTNGPSQLPPGDRKRLDQQGVRVVESPLERVEGEPPGLELVFADGSTETRAALFVSSTLHLGSSIPDQLGCERQGAELVIGSDRQTTVPGVYAAGDIASSKKQVVMAAATGSEAAMMLNGDLAQEEFGGAWEKPLCGTKER